VEKNLLNKKILKGKDAVVFSMPSLEDERMLTDEKTIREKVEQIERQAYEEGFASGEKAGFEEGKQKAGILIDSLQQIIKEIAAFKDNLVENLETQAVDLSVSIARKIINEEVTMRPEVIVTMVKEALRRLQRTGTISVKINPALHELFMEKKAELMEVHDDITFDVNSGIAVTGPLVVSQIEEVVTDIDSLMDNVINEMSVIRTEGRADIDAEEQPEAVVPDREIQNEVVLDNAFVEKENGESGEQDRSQNIYQNN
jgi:hypothetical protein